MSERCFLVGVVGGGWVCRWREEVWGVGCGVCGGGGGGDGVWVCVFKLLEVCWCGVEGWCGGVGCGGFFCIVLWFVFGLVDL